jgi:CubicO group peptidase (beta-lactamase class C family)
MYLKTFKNSKMTRLAGVLFLMLALAACLPRTPVSFTARMDSLLLAQSFNGVVLVAENGNPRYHRAFGYRDYRLALPLDTGSVFEMASVSKAFTAMVMLQLHDQHRLRFEDSLRRYLPELPYSGISLRHLLNHTSGLPDYQAVMDAHWDKSKVAGNADNIDYLIRYAPPVLFKPGERYAYSNTGYMVLATVAERVTGRDFLDLCRTGIFQPLKMTNTDIRSHAEKLALPNVAWGHIYDSAKGRYVQADSFPAFNYTLWLGNRKGPGRISSTSRDMLKWDAGLYSGQLVSDTTLSQAFQPALLADGTTSQYGFGWELSVDPVLGKFVHHSGDNPGYKAYIIRYVEKHVTVVVLCNQAMPAFEGLIRNVQTLAQTEFGGTDRRLR